MALQSTLLHTSSLVQIRHVVCQPDEAGCGDLECSLCHSIVLPLRGIFLRHDISDDRTVADRHHALFFRPGAPYRVSHPAGGDECLAFDFASASLEELDLPIAANENEGRGRAGATSVRLSAAAILSKHQFFRSLQSRNLTSLEADERALELAAACVSWATTRRSEVPRRRTQARLQRRVQGTLLALSAEPERGWMLAELARNAHTSPWHLARSFRREVGMSLHQFQLLARLSHALDPILDRDTNLSALALDLGFSSHSHFTAAFRKMFGLSPTQLRSQCTSREVAELRARLNVMPRRREDA